EQLEREPGREDPVDPEVGRDGGLVQLAEDMAATMGRGGQWIGDRLEELRTVAAAGESRAGGKRERRGWSPGNRPAGIVARTITLSSEGAADLDRPGQL